MSSKASKRKQRRINAMEEEQQDKKIEESTVISKEVDKTDKPEKCDETESEESTKNKENNISTKTEEETSEEVKKDVKITAETQKSEEDCVIITEKRNGQPEEIPTLQKNTDEEMSPEQNTNSGQNFTPEPTFSAEVACEVEVAEPVDTKKQEIDEANSDIEPLIVDSDEAELLFQSETNSEISSDLEKSPILSRSMTRRAQYRQLLTPKTPKSLDFKQTNESKSEKCLNEVRVNVTRLEIDQDSTPSCEVKENEGSGKMDEQSLNSDELYVETESGDVLNTENTENSFDSDQNISDVDVSVFVNYTGNNTTRNFDVTTSSNMEERQNIPSFIDTTKELSYGETLRCLTGRRPTRPVPDYKYDRSYKSNIDLSKSDQTDAEKKYEYFPPRVNLKRKLEVVAKTDLKRKKIEDNSGILSMFGSPFRGKISRAEIPCSTPKLINYKHVEESDTIIDDVSKISPESEEKEANSSKKWCNIM